MYDRHGKVKEMKLRDLQEVMECHTQLAITDWSGYHSGELCKCLCYVDYIPFEYEECEIEIIKVVAANRLNVIVQGKMKGGE